MVERNTPILPIDNEAKKQSIEICGRAERGRQDKDSGASSETHYCDENLYRTGLSYPVLRVQVQLMMTFLGRKYA